MKHCRLIGGFVMVSLLVAGAKAQEPAPSEVAGQVEFDLLVVQMPDSLATPLIPELRDAAHSTKASNEVMKLIAAKKAKLIGWPVLTVKSRVRGVIEQSDEFRYATEFEAPGRSEVTKLLPERKDVSSTTAGDPTSALDSADDSKKLFEKTVSISEGIPRAFETRNLGVMFEVEPIIADDGRTIELTLVPQHVRLLRMRKTEMEMNGAGKGVVVPLPEFASNKVVTTISVIDGEHTLLGVFKLEDPPDTMELFILHTQLRRIGVPAAKAKPAPTPPEDSGPPLIEER